MRPLIRIALPLAVALTLSMSVLSGCAHYYLPVSQLETPEATGPDRIGRLELVGIQSGVDLISTPTQQPTDPKTGKTPDPTLSESPINYVFGATLAVTRELDVGIKIEPFAPLVLRGKYQFMGDPESQADAGNFSISGSASGGLLFSTYQGNGVSFFSFTGAVIGGYRIWKHHLASLSPFFNVAGLSGVGTPSGTGTLYGASLGYQYDAEALIVRAELTWCAGSFSQETGSVNPGGFYPGLLMGLKL
jgi:hypothetical protein